MVGEEIGAAQCIAGAHRVQRKPEQRAPVGGFGRAEQGRDAVRMNRAHLQTGVDEVEAALRAREALVEERQVAEARGAVVHELGHGAEELVKTRVVVQVRPNTVSTLKGWKRSILSRILASTVSHTGERSLPRPKREPSSDTNSPSASVR